MDLIDLIVENCEISCMAMSSNAYTQMQILMQSIESGKFT